jgi:putative transposase
VLRRPSESVQYAAEAYARHLALIKAKASISRTGCCYDCENVRAAWRV